MISFQTFNFAENGRHLSNQNYRACIRQETGMCSIAYEPCNEQSFRIGHTQMRYVNAHGPYQNDLYQNQVFGPNGAGYPAANNLNGGYPPGSFNGPYQPGPGGVNGVYPPNGINSPYQPGGAYQPGIYGDYPPGVVNSPNGAANTIPGVVSNGMLGPNGMPLSSNGLPQNGVPGSLNALNPNSPTVQSGAGGSPVAGPSGTGNDLPASATSQMNQTIQYDQFGNQINGTMQNLGNMTMPTINMTDINPNATTTTTTSTTPVPQNDDEVEGSGDGDDEEDGTGFSLFSLGSFLTRAALFRSARSMETDHQSRSPRQFFSFCTDRITMPCIVEDFISAGMGSVPSCSPVHCGNSLCPRGVSPCRVESTVTPFGLGFHFGEGLNKGSPEENIGACLKFNQLSCV